MTFDPLTQKPQNKSQLIKWNKANVGRNVYHIRHFKDENGDTVLLEAACLVLVRAGTTVCMYENGGNSYRSDYSGSTFKFALDHYTKVYINPSNRRTYIAEYWYEQEEGANRFAELKQQVPVQTA